MWMQLSSASRTHKKRLFLYQTGNYYSLFFAACVATSYYMRCCPLCCIQCRQGIHFFFPFLSLIVALFFLFFSRRTRYGGRKHDDNGDNDNYGDVDVARQLKPATDQEFGHRHRFGHRCLFALGLRGAENVHHVSKSSRQRQR